jgi:tetraacyldisaccharide 4'-kinase
MSRLYALAAGRRLASGDGYRARFPVVCIGNFTVGGTGKTPLAVCVCDHLRRLGQQPAFLTRGYGGRITTPTLVDAARHTSRDVGDEPLLLSRKAPTVVGRDRGAGAQMLESLDSGATVLIMDDGLQNPSLAKSLSIGVVDARRGFGNGEVLPAGPLRAPLELQLGLVQAIVVTHPPGVPVAPDQGVHGWLRRHFRGPVLAARTRPMVASEAIAGRRFVAFAGIANPSRFIAQLAELGAEIVTFQTFRDHHAYSSHDARKLLALAEHHGAELITTEKDQVRLAGTDELDTLRKVSSVLPIRTMLDGTEAERLDALLASAVHSSAP